MLKYLHIYFYDDILMRLPTSAQALAAHLRSYKQSYHSFNQALFNELVEKIQEEERKLQVSSTNVKKQSERHLAYCLSQILIFVPQNHQEDAQSIWCNCYDKLVMLAQQDNPTPCSAASNNLGMFYLKLSYSYDPRKYYKKLARKCFRKALASDHNSRVKGLNAKAAYNLAMMLNSESASKDECQQVLLDLLCSDLSRNAVTSEDFFRSILKVSDLIFTIWKFKKERLNSARNSQNINQDSREELFIAWVNERMRGYSFRTQSDICSKKDSSLHLEAFQENFQHLNRLTLPERDIFGVDAATKMILNHLPRCFNTLTTIEKKRVIQVLMSVHYGQNNGERSGNDDALRMYDSLRQAMTDREKLVKLEDLLNLHETLTGRPSEFCNNKVVFPTGLFLTPTAINELGKEQPETIKVIKKNLIERCSLETTALQERLTKLISSANTRLTGKSEEERLVYILRIIKRFMLLHPFKESCDLVARALFLILCWKHDVSFNMPIDYFDNKMLGVLDSEQVARWVKHGITPKDMHCPLKTIKKNNVNLLSQIVRVLQTGGLPEVGEALDALESMSNVACRSIEIPEILLTHCVDHARSLPCPDTNALNKTRSQGLSPWLTLFNARPKFTLKYLSVVERVSAMLPSYFQTLTPALQTKVVSLYLEGTLFDSSGARIHESYPHYYARLLQTLDSFNGLHPKHSLTTNLIKKWHALLMTGTIKYGDQASRCPDNFAGRCFDGEITHGPTGAFLDTAGMNQLHKEVNLLRKEGLDVSMHWSQGEGPNQNFYAPHLKRGATSTAKLTGLMMQLVAQANTIDITKGREYILEQIILIRKKMALLHFFLDGCGRTMLVVFEFLCWRYNIRISPPHGYFDPTMIDYVDVKLMTKWLLTGERPGSLPLEPVNHRERRQFAKMQKERKQLWTDVSSVFTTSDQRHPYHQKFDAGPFAQAQAATSAERPSQSK